GVKVTIDEASLAGVGNIAGTFSFQRGLTGDGDAVVKVLVQGVEVSLGDEDTAELIQVTGGNGGMLITSAGIAGQLEATVNFSALAGLGITVGGIFRLAINNTPDVVAETF